MSTSSVLIMLSPQGVVVLRVNGCRIALPTCSGVSLLLLGSLKKAHQMTSKPSNLMAVTMAIFLANGWSKKGFIYELPSGYVHLVQSHLFGLISQRSVFGAHTIKYTVF